MLNNFLDEEEL